MPFDLPYTIPARFDGHWGHDYILNADIMEFDLVADINNFDPDEAITRGA